LANFNSINSIGLEELHKQSVNNKVQWVREIVTSSVVKRL